MKSYKIKTIKDIQKAVNEDNLDGFMKDFRGFMEASIQFDNLMGLLGGKRANGEFTWNDDGDYGTLKKITIKVKDDSKKER